MNFRKQPQFETIDVRSKDGRTQILCAGLTSLKITGTWYKDRNRTNKGTGTSLQVEDGIDGTVVIPWTTAPLNKEFYLNPTTKSGSFRVRFRVNDPGGYQDNQHATGDELKVEYTRGEPLFLIP